MLVSHSCRFILFLDPMDPCPWIKGALTPWLDQSIAQDRRLTGTTPFFEGMSPAEAELSFDMAGVAFRSYRRIAIIRNPYTKMSHLYDRIAAADRMWQMRRTLGVGDPDYARWLQSTRPDGQGAGYKGAPRWRRFGSWSASAWCGNRITDIVRAEFAEEELDRIFGKIGIRLNLNTHTGDISDVPAATARCDTASHAIIRQRYRWDLSFYENSRADLRLVA